MIKRMNVNIDLETELSADEIGQLITELFDSKFIPFTGGITESTGEYAEGTEEDMTESFEDHQAILDTI